MCTDAQRAELTSLRAAKTALLTGKLKTKARYNDKEVTYAPVDLAALNEAIRELESLCPEQNGASRARRHGYVRGTL
ncbi:gpW protein [Litorimonas taeanensis]|uniref:GpW protein n=1 Tax=Litorimonas taeanensis TaxID=568099 RepID=A0A420WD88_9PROT|nr:gpW family head-tail joining protein [Litorimonas taeanensis]RKQ68953.1 gpW protein [Litorimonas taeanensis]